MEEAFGSPAKAASEKTGLIAGSDKMPIQMRTIADR